MLTKKKKEDENRWALLLKNTKQIYGITKLDIVHSQEYNQTILLFGEHHLKSEITECETLATGLVLTYIVNYLEAILRFRVERFFFDVYIERDLVIEEKKLLAVPEVESKNIKAIYELVSGCLEKIHEKKCTFPNARIHAADARHSGASLPGYSGYTRERMYGLVISLITQDLEIRLANVDESTNVPFMIDVPGITMKIYFIQLKKIRMGNIMFLKLNNFLILIKKVI